MRLSFKHRVISTILLLGVKHAIDTSSHTESHVLMGFKHLENLHQGFLVHYAQHHPWVFRPFYILQTNP